MYMMNDREFSNRKETLHGEFYENALKYPERIALIYENEKVSYKMLRLYALRAANYMWQRGVRRNDKIVVILPRGIGQVAALLGILAIGAAYVPIAMKQPLGRRKKIIENVKPALVLQDEAFLEENPWTGCIENNSKDTAYIIYTSGSSGEPKGVEMSHVAAMNTIEEILHMWNIGAEDSVLNISAFDFDLSVFDIFGLLTVGGTIVLIDEDDFRDPEVWKNLIEIYGITIWNSAPALLDMFLIMGENNHFGKLRLALVSGDWIPLYLPEKWYKVTSANSQFVALGGATEGGIWSNYYCVSKVDRLWNSIPYGQALPKQKYRITDENFVECGVDIPGELQIGGGSLAKGYINDEELTMKKFITDVKGERWYRTGDRGRRWADGTIEFLGRMDTQVKIRGHRIELGEIESVLKSISRIKEAVVVAQGDKYHKELVAFYLGEYIAESEIEDYLKIHLPEYSIPNSINRLENFPLNANGKVDRRRLAEYQKTDSVEIMSDKVYAEVISRWSSNKHFTLNLPIQNRPRKIMTNAQMISLGGATEGGIWSIYHEIDEIEERPTILYGKALLGQWMGVVDEELRICPEYVSGQIAIGGYSLAEGYLGDTTLTKEKFVYVEEEKNRIYLTGDNGRYVENGDIEFLGRLDNQVKINGHRIEIAEIENAIRGMQNIEDCCVVYNQSILLPFPKWLLYA